MRPVWNFVTSLYILFLLVSQKERVTILIFSAFSNYICLCIRVLSTLWSQAAFHNVPHFSRGRQKSGIKVQFKITVAVQKVKTPVHFIPLFWNNIQQKDIITINAPLILKMRDFRTFPASMGFLCSSLTWKTCRFTVPPAVPLLNYISVGFLSGIFSPDRDDF